MTEPYPNVHTMQVLWPDTQAHYADICHSRLRYLSYPLNNDVFTAGQKTTEQQIVQLLMVPIPVWMIKYKGISANQCGHNDL